MTQQLLLALAEYGLVIVFVNVLINQIGLPVPAVPTLVVAGAMSADGQLPLAPLFAAAVAACCIADCGWYLVGERYGTRVLKLLCRVSLEPDSCVSQTEARFERWGTNSLVIGKFIPGLAIIAPPMAGAMHIGWLRFLGLTVASALLWVGCMLGAGMLFKAQIAVLLLHMGDIGGLAGVLVGAALLAYIAFKWWERTSFLKSLRMARIDVAQLYELMQAGANPTIVDVRSATARALEPHWIPGALHVPLEEVATRLRGLPRDGDVILYCSCPSEASAARVARLLVSHGFKNVRPLQGGLDAWVAAGYAVVGVGEAGQARVSPAAAVPGAARATILARTGEPDEGVNPLTQSALHHVVIVGAGFGGMAVCHGLAGTPTRITVVDQRNHHLFQPLLYQVGTAVLATSEIAWPIRHLLRKRKEVTTLLGVVTGVDVAGSRVLLEDGEALGYDTLVLATGARHAYFGHDEWEPFAPGLKTLEDATSIRRRILLSLERAERETDPVRRAALLTFVIIGGGPTGVELAGAIAELAHQNLREDFRRIDTRKARVLLIEAGPRILPSFTADLSAYALGALGRLGVEVRVGAAVSDCTDHGVIFGGQAVAADVILWAAGVRASPAAAWLGVPADQAGRVKVAADLSVPGHTRIFVIGDTATVNAWQGKPVPGIAPAAKQQGEHVARTISQRLRGQTQTRTFRYWHSGNLATIGKRSAVIDFGWLKLRGRLAWWTWGFAHIYFLIGLRNRLAVALSWLWIYVTGNRSACLITQVDHRNNPTSTPGG
jgi:NADH dehydrogenase